MMSRPPQARRSRCLDIICASCYGVVKRGTKFPTALKMLMGILQKKQNWGIDRTKEIRINA